MSHDHKNLLFLGPNPLVTLAEWIPFGTNNLILLEEKLEAHNKWGECLLTALIDEDPETSTVELEDPETKVMPVDGRDGEWIAFQGRGELQSHRRRTSSRAFYDPRREKAVS